MHYRRGLAAALRAIEGADQAPTTARMVASGAGLRLAMVNGKG
ncbi:MAG: hypothetical protein AAFX81_16065 [Pseudomonadota bacterium]